MTIVICRPQNPKTPLIQINFKLIMGLKLSIDKHISQLDDILDMAPSYFNKIKFESKVPEEINQHLKVLS